MRSSNGLSRSEFTPALCHAERDAASLFAAESKPDKAVIYSHSLRRNAITFSAHFLFNALSNWLIIELDFIEFFLNFLRFNGLCSKKKHKCSARVNEISYKKVFQ